MGRHGKDPHGSHCGGCRELSSLVEIERLKGVIALIDSLTEEYDGAHPSRPLGKLRLLLKAERERGTL